jgi:hypothetical protein
MVEDREIYKDDYRTIYIQRMIKLGKRKDYKAGS